MQVTHYVTHFLLSHCRINALSQEAERHQHGRLHLLQPTKKSLVDGEVLHSLADQERKQKGIANFFSNRSTPLRTDCLYSLHHA